MAGVGWENNALARCPRKILSSFRWFNYFIVQFVPVHNGVFFKFNFLSNYLYIYQTQYLKNFKQKYLILTEKQNKPNSRY